MTTEVTIIGLGQGKTDYIITFSQSLTSTEQLELGEPNVLDNSPPTLRGTVSDGMDKYVGEGDVTIENPTGNTIFGDPPAFDVEVNGTRGTVQPGETVEFNTGGDGGGGMDMVEVTISGVGTATSDYKIESEGMVEAIRNIEFFGDEIIQQNPGIITGKINPEGIDVWGVTPPFTINNLAKSVEELENRDISVKFGGEDFILEQGSVLSFDGNEASVKKASGSGLIDWVVNNPGKAAALGIGTVVVLNKTTETTVEEII